MATNLVLQTWKQISEYVGRTERTVQRWEQQFGFPVHRPSGKSRSSVMALAEEIEEWTRGKPSLVVIRQTARLSGAELCPDVPHNSNSSTHGSFADASTNPVAGLIGQTLQQVTVERRKCADLLWKKQKDLRGDVMNLLREQRCLREKLRLLTTAPQATLPKSS